MRSPLSGWHGGKYLLSKQIISNIPNHECYVEPFAGAAWVLFRKQPSHSEVLNDINHEIVTLYRVLQNHPEEFLRYAKLLPSSRVEFERMMGLDVHTLTDVQRAVRFYYLQKSAFAGKIADNPTWRISTSRPPLFNPQTIESDIDQVRQRLARVYIECMNYDALIKRYDRAHTFFYIDPPYYGCEERYGKGIFARSDFAALVNLLTSIKGKFLLSINDAPEIRALFKTFNQTEVVNRYSCNPSNPQAKVTELLISNYELGTKKGEVRHEDSSEAFGQKRL